MTTRNHDKLCKYIILLLLTLLPVTTRWDRWLDKMKYVSRQPPLATTAVTICNCLVCTFYHSTVIIGLLASRALQSFPSKQMSVCKLMVMLISKLLLASKIRRFCSIKVMKQWKMSSIFNVMIYSNFFQFFKIFLIYLFFSN